ncbi:alpha/beta fold hydrolase [Dyella nitratireducens]|uniref:Hydrolase n=1 Tax=Dyella nitratireducens TaxID=1849580 RepID=A0ABQ1FQ95_9GAMM|nr:alpha/beta hydrolase [Dyella nitratireducens]GGA23938.1 hydrolase [Dyella nitratireducens]GLQ43898.1 hydrolase [Dyella nitratireducens]
MQRRAFLQLTAGLITSGMLAAYAPGLRAAVSSTDERRFHASRRFVQTPFGRIAYVERGTGETALFLHGFPLNSFQWRGALDRLSPYRRCIAPDFLGLGYTEVADGQSVAPDAQVAMLVALLDTLGVAHVDLVGSDSGGAVAQLFVTKHPERVRSLLLTNCDTEHESPPAAMLPVIALSHQGKFVDQWLAPWLADKKLARSPQGIGGMCYADPTDPTDEAIDCYFAPLVSSPHRKALVHAYAIALEHNPLAGIAPALHRCKVPTRVVWGVDDTIFSLAGAEYLDKTLGHSLGVRRVANAKLFFPEERPDVIAEEARRLWQVVA